MSRRSLIKRLMVGVVASGAIALPTAPAAAAAEEAPPVWWLNENKQLTTNHDPTVLWGELKLASEAVGEIHCLNGITGAVWNEGSPSRGHGAEEGWGTNACKAPTLESALKEIFKKEVTVFATAELPLEPELREGEVCKEESKLKITECENASEREPAQIVWKTRRRVSSFPWNIELYRTERSRKKVVVPRMGVPTEPGLTCYPKEKVVIEGKEVERNVTWEKVPAGCVKIDVIAPQIPDEVMFYGTLEPQLVNGSTNGLNPSSFSFTKAAGLLVSSKEVAPGTESLGTLLLLDSEGQQLLTGQ